MQETGQPKERPIIFSGPMVRAILDGSKTQTRRVVKRTDTGRVKLAGSSKNWHLGDPDCVQACPYGTVGSRLWVRESWQHAPVKFCRCSQPSEASPCDDWSNGTGCKSDRGDVIYRADQVRTAFWRSPIFMPRWASRILLEITEVRVQRVQDESKEAAEAEGLMAAWARNEWVWAISFRRI